MDEIDAKMTDAPKGILIEQQRTRTKSLFFFVCRASFFITLKANRNALVVQKYDNVAARFYKKKTTPQTELFFVIDKRLFWGQLCFIAEQLIYSQALNFRR